MKQLLLLSFLFLALAVQAELNPKCIRTKVLEGDTCRTLQVDFDFSRCGLHSLAGQTVKSTCVNGKAVAFVKNESEVYIATYGAPAEEGKKWKYLSLRKEVRKGKSAPAILVSEPESVQKTEPEVMKKAEEVAEQTNAEIAEKKNEVVPAAAAESAPAIQEQAATLPENLVQLSKMKFNGHVDAYYTYNMNSPSPNTTPTAGTLVFAPATTNRYRAYDGYHDQFTLAMAMMRLQKMEDGTGFVIDFGFGQNTAVMAGYAESTQYIPQAYMKWQMSPSWNLYFGKMMTHMGLESSYSVENWSYSRSLLYTFGLPISHTGLALEWKVSPTFVTTMYLYNNWSGAFEYNKTKNLGFRFDYTPSENFNIKYNVIGGNEKTAIPDSIRIVHDLNFTWMMSSEFGLQVDSILGGENKAQAGADVTWSSVLAGLLWKMGKNAVDLRVEMFADTNGYAIAGGFGSAAANIQNLSSIVLGHSWQLGSGLKSRFELRQDQSDKNVFTDMNGAVTNAQLTGTLAFTAEY